MAFLKRKSTWLAVIAGLLSVLVCWFWLLPSARFSLPLSSKQGVTFSADFRVMALWTIEDSSGPTQKGLTTLVEIPSGRTLCSFPFPKGSHSTSAFTDDGKFYVEFIWNDMVRVQFRDVTTGAVRQPDWPAIFPVPKGSKDRSVDLVTDVKGRPYALVGEKGKPWSVVDVITGKEVGSFAGPSQGRYSGNISGCMLFRNSGKEGAECREVPTGNHVFEVPWTDLMDSWWFSAGGNVKVHLLPLHGKIVIQDVLRGDRELKVLGASCPRLSRNGRYLLVQIEPQTVPHPLLVWLKDRGLASDIKYMRVLYDLETGSEVASFNYASGVEFSCDGQSLAVLADRVLSIYDLPIRKPWGRIIGWGLFAAGAVLGSAYLLTRIRRKQSHLSGANGLPGPAILAGGKADSSRMSDPRRRATSAEVLPVARWLALPW